MNRRRIEQRSLAFLIIFAFLFNAICVSANYPNDDGVDDDTVLTIAESCAPKSRSRRAITVDRMTMTCSEDDDQSPSCSVGSFAQVTLDFWLKKYSRGSKLDIRVSSIYSGSAEVVMGSTNLCLLSYDILSAKSRRRYNDDDANNDYQTCNLVLGKYRAYLNFTVPDFGFNDNELHFTPDLRVKFFDSTDHFKIGCVESGSLAERALRITRDKRGTEAFMLCIVIFVMMFAILLCCFKGRKQLSDIDLANRRALRRFNYRQTTKNGTMQNGEDMVMSVSQAGEWSRRQFT
ncbi:unnamed protein product [Cylindrotheca closterium]|uniref:Uncharacterized protein n=1 Tax=Cylindrotheca closterium TaxID=2856 RepID=A0AAD2FU32_9STRA|nr:unnamed protein product [Cylindrotheca closterium]